MSDIYDPMIDRLDQVNSNLIDIETAVNKTNELLGKILEALDGGTQSALHNTRLDLLNSLRAQKELKNIVDKFQRI